MPGALEALEKALLRLRSAMEPEVIRPAADRIGEQYTLAADARPVFERGRRFANSPEGLALQFGTSTPMTPPRGSPLASMYDYVIHPNPRAKLADPGGLNAAVRDHAYLRDPEGAGNYDAVRELQEAGLLPRGADYHIYDTLASRQNSGEGTRLYASAFGNLRLSPNAVNLSEALSGANAKRRTVNQASALLRDPSLAQSIIISPSQLIRDKYRHINDLAPLYPQDKSSARWLSPKDFHSLTPNQQFGALQMMSAHDTLAAVRGAYLRDADRLKSYGYQSEKEALETQRRLNATRGMDYYAPGALGAGSPAEGALSGLARAYQTTPSSALMPLGTRTLKNARLTGDLLEGADWKSLPPELWEGVFYCDGGPVRRP